MADDVCIFCDNAPDSTEHAWPDWIRLHLLQTDEGVRTVAKSLDDLETVTIDRFRDFALTTEAVCDTCNQNWMRKTEEKVNPFLKAMMLGEPHQLTPTEQWWLVRWVAKTVRVMQSLQPPDERLMSRTRSLRIPTGNPKQPFPLPGLGVALGRYRGHRLLDHFGVIANVQRVDEGGEDYLYWGTFLLGEVFVQVIDHASDREPPATTDFFREVFVPLRTGEQSEVDWPPKLIIGDVGLDMVMALPGKSWPVDPDIDRFLRS